MVEDLWPKQFEQTKSRPPVAIIKEQASLLGTKTKNVVEGSVTKVMSDSGDDIKYNFYLVAPVMGNYRYLLFGIEHDIRMYPLFITLESEILEEVLAQMEPEGTKKRYSNRYVQVENEEEFRDALKKIFSAKKTREIISAILTQSST
jgi:hypothetical protein